MVFFSSTHLRCINNLHVCIRLLLAVPFISFKQCGKLDSNKNDKYTFTSTWKDRALCSLKFYCCRCTLESINIKSTSIIFILDFMIINKHLASVWSRDFENESKEIIQYILMTWLISQLVLPERLLKELRVRNLLNIFSYCLPNLNKIVAWHTKTQTSYNMQAA